MTELTEAQKEMVKFALATVVLKQTAQPSEEAAVVRETAASHEAVEVPTRLRSLRTSAAGGAIFCHTALARFELFALGSARAPDAAAQVDRELTSFSQSIGSEGGNADAEVALSASRLTSHLLSTASAPIAAGLGASIGRLADIAHGIWAHSVASGIAISLMDLQLSAQTADNLGVALRAFEYSALRAVAYTQQNLSSVHRQGESSESSAAKIPVMSATATADCCFDLLGLISDLSQERWASLTLAALALRGTSQAIQSKMSTRAPDERGTLALWGN